jgi:hypothetical protein
VSDLSLEPGTENPRVENSVITLVSMHSEGSDLIGAFLCSDGFFVEGDIPVFFFTSYYRQWLEKYVNTFWFFISVKHCLLKNINYFQGIYK